ncbi:MAG: FecR domain-containing protein [Candidatus Omnitrophota bacterium]|nr:MAG: FecR domain-containing protein [Candidatus Omnitrophota bacterium]
MKKSFLFFVLAHCLLLSSAFGQMAKIVDVKGTVLVKRDVASSWKRARVDMYLKRQAEIKTRRNSECTVAFDEELSNILTIKENSHIKMQDLRPGNIYLPKGRVFSLIEDIAKLEKFEIRTPTAVAGVRGTGKTVEANRGGSTVKCFEGRVYVEGLSKSGGSTGREYLSGGFGIDAGPGGELGDIFKLTYGDRGEWNAFRDRLDGLRGRPEQDDIIVDLQEERREDLRDDFFEDFRKKIELQYEKGGGSS